MCANDTSLVIGEGHEDQINIENIKFICKKILLLGLTTDQRLNGKSHHSVRVSVHEIGVEIQVWNIILGKLSCCF